MLRSVQRIHGYAINATDGEIGTVDDLLFDDERWTVRYLVVDTGGWLSGRRVLLSPISLKTAYWDAQRLDVNLTRRQVEQSPDIYTDLPVSRQKEIEFASYYNYPLYWGGSGLWGGGMVPGMLAYPGTVAPLPPVPPTTAVSGSQQQPAQEEQGDPHLRSTREVIGYTIAATDDDIGHVEDFLLDEETWALRYMVVDTRNWLPGKQVLVAPSWIGDIQWANAAVRVDLPRDTIKNAPEYDSSTAVTRAYEQQLHDYYRRPAYWQH